MCFFFFQAEDGIRDWSVTGVQTCALPIYCRSFIAAIAIPNLLRSRMAANEASAVGSLRTIDTAEMTFTTTYPDVGYANLASLGGAATACATATGATSTTACLIDDVLANTAVKSGYNFTTTAGGGAPAVTDSSLALPSVVGP